MDNYRILALDGGGIRGLMTLVLLRRLEEEVPGWLDKVDLLAGTSTGATIAIGLADGASPDDLSQLYYELCSNVFSQSRPGQYLKIRKLARAGYDSKDFAVLLRKALGEKRLCDLPKKILVTAFDLDNDHEDASRRCWQTAFFHNLGSEDGIADMEVYKVALYSCATPIYFPSIDGFVDGAVAAQNPSLAALAHARDEMIHEGECPALENIVLLSVGTGKAPHYIEGQRLNWGYAQWTRVMVDMMLEGSVDLVDRICRPLLRSHYHRIGPWLPHMIHADEWKRRDELIELAEDIDLRETIGWLRSFWSASG